jgi:hypothetical protein
MTSGLSAVLLEVPQQEQELQKKTQYRPLPLSLAFNGQPGQVVGARYLPGDEDETKAIWQLLVEEGEQQMHWISGWGVPNRPTTIADEVPLLAKGMTETLFHLLQERAMKLNVPLRTYQQLPEIVLVRQVKKNKWKSWSASHVLWSDSAMMVNGIIDDLRRYLANEARLGGEATSIASGERVSALPAPPAFSFSSSSDNSAAASSSSGSSSGIIEYRQPIDPQAKFLEEQISCFVFDPSRCTLTAWLENYTLHLDFYSTTSDPALLSIWSIFFHLLTTVQDDTDPDVLAERQSWFDKRIDAQHLTDFHGFLLRNQDLVLLHYRASPDLVWVRDHLITCRQLSNVHKRLPTYTTKTLVDWRLSRPLLFQQLVLSETQKRLIHQQKKRKLFSTSSSSVINASALTLAALFKTPKHIDVTNFHYWIQDLWTGRLFVASEVQDEESDDEKNKNEDEDATTYVLAGKERRHGNKSLSKKRRKKVKKAATVKTTCKRKGKRNIRGKKTKNKDIFAVLRHEDDLPEDHQQEQDKGEVTVSDVEDDDNQAEECDDDQEENALREMKLSAELRHVYASLEGEDSP